MLPIFLSLLLFYSIEASPSHSLRDRWDKKEPIEQIFENQDLDDPSSECRNGGVWSGRRCHCIFPHTGKECTDYQCVHGMSVGLRYEPKSLLFNKPCICTAGWSGDLCEYQVSQKCSNYGEWKNGHCECIGYHFGEKCQYVSKCVNGKKSRGRCECDDNWEGDYCSKIICHHGTVDLRNRSMSCICSKRYTGQYCDACSKQPYPVSPYPECEQIRIRPPPTPRPPKKKPTHDNTSRVVVLSVAGCFLFVFTIFMAYFSYKYSSSKEERDRQKALTKDLKQRRAELQEAAKDLPEEEDEPFLRSWRWGSKKNQKRKSSLGNIFRFSTKDSRGHLSANQSTNTFEAGRLDASRASS